MARNNFPKTLGACVDLVYQMEQARLAKQREYEADLKRLSAAQQALEDHIIGKFSKQEIDGAKGDIASVSLVETPTPTNVDWPKVWAYIRKHNAFDLLEKRIGRVAWRLRLGTKNEVPGIEVFMKKSLSLRKRS
jgi:hypothetical protein